jgi:hypothetical protein
MYIKGVLTVHIVCTAGEPKDTVHVSSMIPTIYTKVEYCSYWTSTSSEYMIIAEENKLYSTCCTCPKSKVLKVLGYTTINSTQVGAIITAYSNRYEYNYE